VTPWSTSLTGKKDIDFDCRQIFVRAIRCVRHFTGDQKGEATHLRRKSSIEQTTRAIWQTPKALGYYTRGS